MTKQASAVDAVSLIKDGDVVAISGFVGTGAPDELLCALEARFLETGSPRNLTLMFGAAAGDRGDQGLNRLAHEGLVGCLIGGHYGLTPKLGELVTTERCQAYNLPLGTVTHMFRDIGGGRPWTISKVGLRTFVDPRCGGGRMNDRTTNDIVSLIEIDGEEYLKYRVRPVDVALLRGTTADPKGNVTMEREALTLDNRVIAMAARNSGGTVIVQVESVGENGSLNARHVEIPGVMVDHFVVGSPEMHRQTYSTTYNRAYSCEVRVPVEASVPAPLDARKIIARRVVQDLPRGGVVNLGIGMPEGVAAVAQEEQLLNSVILTAEPGVLGGLPSNGLDFGTAVNTDALIHMYEQFDFYDGGGIDLACLGMAQCDARGNVNVSRFGTKLAGAGGFINISQSAKNVVFAGTFTSGGLVVKVEDGKLIIVAEGRSKKFVGAVEQLTFNGRYAAARGQSVKYVTERCVFECHEDGLELAEVAPGISIENDILAHMEFEPIVIEPKQMDSRLFDERRMSGH